jgi:hypothetical protein
MLWANRIICRLVGDENLGALEDGRVDHVPDDQPERHIREMLGERQFEQLRVEQAHRHRCGSGGDGDPERAEHRPAVLLLDVLPAQEQPQFALAESVDQVTPGSAEGPGLAGRLDDGHLLLPWGRNFS